MHTLTSIDATTVTLLSVMSPTAAIMLPTTSIIYGVSGKDECALRARGSDCVMVESMVESAEDGDTFMCVCVCVCVCVCA